MSDTTAAAPSVEEIFQRSLTAHLPPPHFERLRSCRVLIAGMGGGSNIAELLVRKGVGRLVLADLDRYECHNVRQRGCTTRTLGRPKVEVMRERLIEINPHVEVTGVPEGITLANADWLARESDFVVDMIDLHAIREKVALSQAARRAGRWTLTAPSVVNGAVLYVFAPDGISFERFFGYEEGLPVGELGARMLRRLIPRYAPEAPEALYLAAARGERTIPLDAVGVDQAAVLLVSAIENLALGRRARVIPVPRGIQVDVSDPAYLARIVDFSPEFGTSR